MKQFFALILVALSALPLQAGGIQKNVSGQKLTVIAFDSATGRPKTGDAANLTAYVAKDDGSLTALTDTSASEISSTNAPGKYLFDLSQAETNANKLDFGAKSSTSGVDLFAVPSVVYTSPANFQATVIDSSGYGTTNLTAASLAASRSAAINPSTVPTISQLITDFPHPFTREILTVGDRAFEILERNCPLTRGTTYYIEYDAAGNGTGGTGNGTLATPWLVSTYGNLETLIEAQQTGGNKAFLFKRGEGLYGSGQIDMSVANVTYGTYGTGAKPYFRRATTVSSGWTLSSGTKYTRTETTDVAWVRLPGSKTLPLSRLSSAASVPTTITGCGGTFHYDSGTDVLTVDMGVNLNATTVEIIYDNTQSGVLVTEPGCRVDGWDLAGFGMDVGNEANQAAPIKVTIENEEMFLGTNIGAAYGSTHVLSCYGASDGGHVGFDGCDASWPITSTGPTIINGYAPDGDHSFYVRNCFNYGGELPSGTAPVSDAALVYGHSNGTAARLFWAEGCIAAGSDVTPFTSTLNAWGHAPTTSGDIGLCRAYFAGCDIGELYCTTGAADTAFINTRGKYYATGSGSIAQQQAGDDRGYWINHKQEIVVNSTNTATSWAVVNKASSATNDAQRYFCEIRWTGNDTNTTCWWNYRTGIFGDTNNCAWVGCTYIDDSSLVNVLFAGGNAVGKPIGNKFYDIQSLSDANAGVTNDPFYSTASLGASPRPLTAPGAGGELALNTFLIGPEYDYEGKPRNISLAVAGPRAPAQSDSWGAPASTQEIADTMEQTEVAGIVGTTSTFDELSAGLADETDITDAIEALASYIDLVANAGNAASFAQSAAGDANTAATEASAAKTASEAVQAKLPSANAKMAGEGATAKNLDQVEGGGGGGEVIPVNQIPVPLARTWVVTPTDDGLVSETTLTLKAGKSALFAIDFREDLPTNGRLKETESVAIATGTADGVAFPADLADLEDAGVDKTQAKLRITGVTPGTYEIDVAAERQTADGGGSSTARVTLHVIE